MLEKQILYYHRLKSESSLPLISETTFPESVTFPSVGVSKPDIMLRNVVLPEPEGPTKAVNSPELIVRSTPVKCIHRNAICLIYFCNTLSDNNFFLLCLFHFNYLKASAHCFNWRHSCNNAMPDTSQQ